VFIELVRAYDRRAGAGGVRSTNDIVDSLVFSRLPQCLDHGHTIGWDHPADRSSELQRDGHIHLYSVSPVNPLPCTGSPPPRSLPRLLRKLLRAMSGSTGDLSACHLLGSMFACTLYSAYVFAFGASVYFLFNVRGRRVHPNKILLTVSVILFICVTVVHPTASFFESSLTILAAMVFAQCLHIHGVRRPWRHGQRCAGVLQRPCNTTSRATIRIQRDHCTSGRHSRALFFRATRTYLLKYS
jgi:hypothetical protein